MLLKSPWHSRELLLAVVVQRGATGDDIKNREVAMKKFREVTKAYKILPGAKKWNDYDKSTEAGLSGKLKRSRRGKAYNTHKDIKNLNSEYIITHF